MAATYQIVPQPTVRTRYVGPENANTLITYSGFVYFDPELNGNGANWLLEPVRFALPSLVPGAAGGQADPFTGAQVQSGHIGAICFPMLFSNENVAQNAGWGTYIGASRNAATGHIEVTIDASVRDADGKIARIGYQVTVLATLPEDHLLSFLKDLFTSGTTTFKSINVTVNLVANAAKFTTAIIDKAVIKLASIEQATINRLSATKATIQQLGAKAAAVLDLKATNARIHKAEIDEAAIQKATLAVADIKQLTYAHANRLEVDDLAFSAGAGDSLTLRQLTVNRDATIARAEITDLFVPATIPEARKLILVRATGSDAGDGSAAAPYRTVQRALQDVPLVLNGQRVFIDCTGIGVESFPAQGFQFPITLGTGRFVAATPGAFFDGHLSYESELTIAAAHTVLEQVDTYLEESDPVTKLVTISVAAPTWTPGQFRGKLAVWDDEWIMAAVIDNTETEIELAVDFVPGGPLRIVEPSAEFRVADTDYFSQSSIELTGTQASVKFYGIRFSHAANSAWPYVAQPIKLCNTLGTTLDGCVLQGLTVLENSAGVSGYAIVIDSGGGSTGRVDIQGTGLALQYSVLRDVALNQHSAFGRTQWKLFMCGVIHCSPLGHGAGTAISHSSPEDLLARMSFDVEYTLVRDAQGHGVLYRGGAPAYVRNVRIVDAGGDAVRAIGPGRLQLDACEGSGSAGYGVNVLDGAHVVAEDPGNEVFAECTVTGALGDVHVGLHAAARSWANLHTASPTGNEFDYKGDGSRLSLGSVPVESYA